MLWQKAGEFDSTREFMPWAMRIARFQALAYWKKQKRVPKTFDESLLSLLADEAIAESASLDPRRRALAGCVQKLPDRQRELISRRYEPGASVNEMARRRDMTPKALSESLRRIRNALLQCIERTLAQEARG